MSCKKCGIEHVGLCKQIDSRCVIYNNEDEVPSSLLCFLELENGVSAHEIFETLDEKLCQIYSPTIETCYRNLTGIGEDVSLSEFLTSLQTYLCTLKDENVKVTPNDTTSGYLFDKIITGDCINSTVNLNEVTGERKLLLSLDFDCILDKIKDNIEIPQCYTIDCVSCEDNPSCTPQPITPVITHTIGASNATLICQNCNLGYNTWYKDGVVVGYTNTITVDQAGVYTARNTTACGVSEDSNSITIPEFITYTYTRTGIFTRNNCGFNGCGVSCIGTSVPFSKVYTSPLSQAHAQSIANSDTQFPILGQNNANLLGQCNCPSCECTEPTIGNHQIINATCLGNSLQSNGRIIVTGIQNGNKWGISFNSVTYQGPTYENAYFLGYSSGNITSTATSITYDGLDVQESAIIRIFNASGGCKGDFYFDLIPANCDDEDPSVDLGTIGVSC